MFLLFQSARGKEIFSISLTVRLVKKFYFNYTILLTVLLLSWPTVHLSILRNDWIRPYLSLFQITFNTDSRNTNYLTEVNHIEIMYNSFKYFLHSTGFTNIPVFPSCWLEKCHSYTELITSCYLLFIYLLFFLAFEIDFISFSILMTVRKTFYFRSYNNRDGIKHDSVVVTMGSNETWNSHLQFSYQILK